MPAAPMKPTPRRSHTTPEPAPLTGRRARPASRGGLRRGRSDRGGEHGLQAGALAPSISPTTRTAISPGADWMTTAVNHPTGRSSVRRRGSASRGRSCGSSIEASPELSPEGVPFGEIAPERPEEFGPGLDPELMELVQATAEMELAEETAPPQWGPTGGDGVAARIKDTLTP